MEIHTIVTWKTEAKLEPEPWNAFIMPEGQDPADYFAEYCAMLDEHDLYKIGETEAQAVSKLFETQAPKPNDPDKDEIRKIYERNSKLKCSGKG